MLTPRRDERTSTEREKATDTARCIPPILQYNILLRSTASGALNQHFVELYDVD